MAKTKTLIFILISAIFLFLFSYKNLEVPKGLTSDETAFGYNAVLLSRTGRDQNNRLFPVFVLSLAGRDWRQPVTQYYLAALFKVFGSSVFLLRFSSALIAVLSATLLFILSKNLFTVILFYTVPLIMIQSHLGLDNIMTIPFTLLWLLCLKNKKFFWAGISLGIAFYTYKGMRAVVPIWAIISIYYIFTTTKDWRYLRQFIFGGLPFALAIPILEKIYPGAVFDRQGFHFTNIYDFFYPYISTFDLGFLFIKGDDLLFHSTHFHGMYLLSTLPLFLIAIYKNIQKKDAFRNFLIIAFFSAPLLMGFVNSSHRASRIMCMIPIFCLLIGYIYDQIKLKYFIFILMFLNYFDFYHYYMTEYPKFTQNIFGDLTVYKDMKQFKKETDKYMLKPYIDKRIVDDFSTNIYFKQITIMDENQTPPKGSILLSPRENIPELKKLDVKLSHYYVHVN